MTHRRAAAIICLLAVAPGLALGQAPDPAAERARLANERIQAEAESRAREEPEQQNRTPDPAGQATAAPNPPTQPQQARNPAEPPRPSTDADGTERGLEQLRALGKLKDAGYLTDAEFQRIKQRILDSHF
jgi:type IV secretory pathway VirB10-like protein